MTKTSDSALSLGWEEFEVYRQDFGLLDANSSGYLEGAEVSQLLQKQFEDSVTTDMLSAFMEFADIDRDGKINLNEYIGSILGGSYVIVGAPAPDPPPIPTEHNQDSSMKGKLLDEILSAIDLDQNGMLSGEELSEFARAMSASKSLACQNIGPSVVMFAGMPIDGVKKRMMALLDQKMMTELHTNFLTAQPDASTKVDILVPVCQQCGVEQEYEETFYFCGAENSHVRCCSCRPPFSEWTQTFSSSSHNYSECACPCPCGGIFESRTRFSKEAIKTRCVDEIVGEIERVANGYMNGQYRMIITQVVPEMLRDVRGCVGQPTACLKPVLMTLTDQTTLDEIRQRVLAHAHQSAAGC